MDVDADLISSTGSAANGVKVRYNLVQNGMNLECSCHC